MIVDADRTVEIRSDLAKRRLRIELDARKCGDLIGACVDDRREILRLDVRRRLRGKIRIQIRTRVGPLQQRGRGQVGLRLRVRWRVSQRHIG